jgi:V/A-type H+-transporting ATPase subunit D
MQGLIAGREKLEDSLRRAAKAVTLARAIDGEEVLASLALAGAREIPVEIERQKVWGIPTPEVSGPRLLRAPDARGASPTGFGLGAAFAARTHEEALEILLNICSREIRLRRLGEEIRKTSRRINASSSSRSRGSTRRLARSSWPRRARAKTSPGSSVSRRKATESS